NGLSHITPMAGLLKKGKGFLQVLLESKVLFQRELSQVKELRQLCCQSQVHGAHSSFASRGGS
ncbi:MAG: hypothetical protein NT154_39935, partial [Verrucomicrobia bacterium]|nr:hypothetical protein [Verrucomicrobiota bacterium]